MDLQAKTAYAAVKPLVRELPADLETPFPSTSSWPGRGLRSCSNRSPAASRWRATRSSASNPARPSSCAGRRWKRTRAGGHRDARRDDPLAGAGRTSWRACAWRALPGLPRFAGGLVGYLSYEMMRFFEPSVALRAARRPARRHLPAGRYAGGLRPCLRPAAADRQRRPGAGRRGAAQRRGRGAAGRAASAAWPARCPPARPPARDAGLPPPRCAPT